MQFADNMTDLARLPELLCCRTATKISPSTRCICCMHTQHWWHGFRVICGLCNVCLMLLVRHTH